MLQFVLTNAGIAARNSVIAGGGSINFTRAAIGTGTPSLQPEELTNLVSFAANVGLKQSLTDSVTHTFEVLIDNAKADPAITSDIVATEIGVYAQITIDDVEQSEILYAYCVPPVGIYVPAPPAVSVQDFESVLVSGTS